MEQLPSSGDTVRQNNSCLNYSFGSWLIRERYAGSCLIARVSAANEKGVVVDPTPLSKWAYVEFNADFSADLGW